MCSSRDLDVNFLAYPPAMNETTQLHGEHDSPIYFRMTLADSSDDCLYVPKRTEHLVYWYIYC